MIVELIKRRIVGLHQITAVGSTDITDTWEPLEEGLLPLETTRHVSMATITLSKKELDTSSVGYQPPLPEDQVKPLVEFNCEGEGSPRGRGRGRGRGNGNKAVGYGDGELDNRGRGFGGRGRGYGGRGRSFRSHGRGGYGGYNGGYNDYQQENGGYNGGYNDFDSPNPGQGRGRGRGRGPNRGRGGRDFRSNGVMNGGMVRGA